MSNRTAEIVMKIRDEAKPILDNINNAMWNVGQAATTSGAQVSAAVDKTNKELEQQQKKVAAVADAFDKQHQQVVTGAGSIRGAMGAIGSAASAGFGLLSKAAGMAWNAVSYVYDKVMELAKWGLVSLGAALAYSTHAWIEEEESIVRLNSVYRATGGTVGYTAAQLDAYAGQLQKTTAIADDTWRNAMGVLLTFEQVQGPIFKDALALSADLAAVMGGDLQSAVLMVGKALQDPEQGLQALRRAGVIFTDAQKEQIKLLVESGQVYEAQALILDGLRQKVGGTAEAMRDTLGGSLKALWASIGDAAETVGKAFAPIFQDSAEAIRKWVEESTPKIGEFASITAEYVKFAGTVLGSFFSDGSDWSTKLTVVFDGVVKAAEAAFKTIIDLAWTAGAGIAAGLMKAWEMKKGIAAIRAQEDENEKNVRGYTHERRMANEQKTIQDYVGSMQEDSGISSAMDAVMGRAKERFAGVGAGVTASATTMMPDFAGNIGQEWSATQQRIADISREHADAANKVTDSAKEQAGLYEQHLRIKQQIVEMDKSAIQQYMSMTGMERAQTKWLAQQKAGGMDMGSMTPEMQKAISGNSLLSGIYQKEMQEFVQKDLGLKSTAAANGGLKVTMELTDEAKKLLQMAQGTASQQRQAAVVRG